VPANYHLSVLVSFLSLCDIVNRVVIGANKLHRILIIDYVSICHTLNQDCSFSSAILSTSGQSYLIRPGQVDYQLSSGAF